MDPNGQFEGPKTGQGVDQGKFLKLAQRVEETLTRESLYPDPKQLDPNLVLVSPLNRLGGSPQCPAHPLWDPEELSGEFI